MSTFTRNRIDESLTDRVIESILTQVDRKNSPVYQEDLFKIKQRDGLVLRAVLNYIEERGPIESNNNENEEKAVDKITSSLLRTLEWRKEIKLNEIVPEDFPSKFYELSSVKICQETTDDGSVIVVRDESCHVKVSSEWNEIVKLFGIWFLEKVVSQYFNQGKDVCYLMDFSNYSMKNIDPGWCYSFHESLASHFPCICTGAYAIDLPWYAKPVSKMIIKTLPPLNRVYRITSAKEIAKQLGDSLPTCLGGPNALYQPLAGPSRFVSVQEIGDRHSINQDDIDRMCKQFS